MCFSGKVRATLQTWFPSSAFHQFQFWWCGGWWFGFEPPVLVEGECETTQKLTSGPTWIYQEPPGGFYVRGRRVSGKGDFLLLETRALPESRVDGWCIRVQQLLS